MGSVKKMKYEFFIAGSTRNRENILKICDLFDKYGISYYCFLKNDKSYNSYGNNDQNEFEKMEVFESLSLKSDIVFNIYKEDLESEKLSRNFLLVLPAGKSGHIEAGIAYGMGKNCYAVGEYEVTDSLYNIFEEIFEHNNQLEKFLEEYKKDYN